MWHDRATRAAQEVHTYLQKLNSHSTAPVGRHRKDALVVTQQIVLQKVLKNSWVILVSPDEELCKLTQSLDEQGLIEGIDDLVLWIQKYVVYAMELLEGVFGHLVIRLSAEDAAPEPLLSRAHLF